jgi:hypothetical protein
LLILFDPDDREQIATNPIAGRFRQTEHRVGGIRGINAIASRFQHVDADLSR